MNPYRVLGLSDGSSLEDVKRARRRLCAKYHPDSGGDARKFNEVNQAYEMITGKSNVKALVTRANETGVCFDTIFRMKLV